jgi:hypothetical protein
MPNQNQQILIDSYWDMLKHLSHNIKAELISKLSQSLKIESDAETQAAQNITPFKDLFGAFESDKTAEMQIDEIRKARLFNRQIEDF